MMIQSLTPEKIQANTAKYLELCAKLGIDLQHLLSILMKLSCPSNQFKAYAVDFVILILIELARLFVLIILEDIQNKT